MERMEEMISIHAPRVGSDSIAITPRLNADDFNPRSPCGERRWIGDYGFSPYVISIHAPRVGSDSNSHRSPSIQDRFQSTLPVWGATRKKEKAALCCQFQSTLPVWGATLLVPLILLTNKFQSTLPVWGATALVDRDFPIE